MKVNYVIRLLFPYYSILLLLTMTRAENDRPILETEKGKVQGFTDSVNGKNVDIFYGIPFAKPPVGELRFKLPSPLDSWEGILDASKQPNSCIQGFDTFFDNFTGSTMWNPNTPVSEDCLYLNVWVPRTNPPMKDKSVIVWIYGGGFYSGTSTLDVYEARYLAAENDVVVVSMQYRVGPLGFLTLGTREVPGNMGLWDQKMALEWVNLNIHNFGGNPNDVTLMGESAGAVSVGLFLFCEYCSNLFHKAILQSGSPVANWAVLPKEEMWKRSEKYAEHYKCYREGDLEWMFECLRKVDASKFPNHEWVVDGMAQFPFVPVIDGEFIREDPKKMLKQGMFKKVPILLGSNENESTFFLVYSEPDVYNLSPHIEISSRQYKTSMEYNFNWYPHYDIKLNDFGSEAIKFNYKNWLNPEDGVENRLGVDRAVSDFHFVCPTNNLAEAYAREGAPVYYYWFNQRWSANPWPEWMGVLHADELWFTIGQALNTSHSFTQAERDLSMKMMTYWTNFAKTGDPNKSYKEENPIIEWPRFEPNEQVYINLSTDSLTSGPLMGQGPRTQECAFWDIYLPKLVAETSSIKSSSKPPQKAGHLGKCTSDYLDCMLDEVSEAETEKRAWINQYIGDWKTQFDNFLFKFQNRLGGTCEGAP